MVLVFCWLVVWKIKISHFQVCSWNFIFMTNLKIVLYFFCSAFCELFC
jgi:hypothetical protein